MCPGGVRLCAERSSCIKIDHGYEFEAPLDITILPPATKAVRWLNVPIGSDLTRFLQTRHISLRLCELQRTKASSIKPYCVHHGWYGLAMVG